MLCQMVGGASGWMRGGGRTKELLCGDEQVCDGLFDLGQLLLGLHFAMVSGGCSWGQRVG
jgi:hypothetical protein